MEDKKKDILDKAEDVILKKIEHYGKHTEDMDKDDCYALQLHYDRRKNTVNQRWR